MFLAPLAIILLVTILAVLLCSWFVHQFVGNPSIVIVVTIIVTYILYVIGHRI